MTSCDDVASLFPRHIGSLRERICEGPLTNQKRLIYPTNQLEAFIRAD